VHRLDKDTSGLLVVAKTEKAHEKLGAAMAARRIERRYAALRVGPRRRGGAADRGAARAAPRRPQADGHRPGGGRRAVTRVRAIARGGVADLCRAALETGRTHQIRVHLQSIGHPVVGDAVYGLGSYRRGDSTRADAEALERSVPRQALHAAWLTLPHPRTGERIEVRSEWPEDLPAGIGHRIARQRLACSDPAAGVSWIFRTRRRR